MILKKKWGQVRVSTKNSGSGRVSGTRWALATTIINSYYQPQVCSGRSQGWGGVQRGLWKHWQHLSRGGSLLVRICHQEVACSLCKNAFAFFFFICHHHCTDDPSIFETRQLFVIILKREIFLHYIDGPAEGRSLLVQQCIWTSTF